MEPGKAKIDMGGLACLLHSSVFSLEKSIQEIMGRDHIVLTSHAAKYIAAIDEKKGSRLFFGKSLDEAIKNFVDLTSGSEFFDSLDIKKTNGEEYHIDIKGCALAKTGVHNVLNPELDICPMALAAGAVFKYIEPDSDVILKPSSFEDEGSSTEIAVVKII